MLLLFALIVGVGSAWAEDVTVTLTQSSLGLTGSYTSGTEKEIDGITYVYTDLMKNNDNIQAKASTGTIYNKTAFPGDIKSVAITHSGTARATTILGSSNGKDWIQVTTGSGTITGDFSNKGYKYFKITRGSNAAYWTEIKITYTAGGSNLSPNNLALTGAPVALTFDLYNNSSAQTISYTTSSTGAVTVSENAYVTTSVNATTQTITVTPKNAVTPETQTIIVSQAADGTYAAGQVTFTVSVDDSSPFEGGDVTFDATEDKGTSPLTKSVVTFACTNGVLNNGSEYRLYKNSETTFSTSKGKITKIEFTGVSGNPVSGFGSQTGFTTNGNDGTWSGSATSVTFVASGAQVRATKIVVTVVDGDTPTLETSDLALTGAPVALNFDLYNNSDAQTISYTTSSVGAITVSENEYIEAVVDKDAKTIIVTPKAVTPSAQTITVSQESDEAYAAGQVTFTVTVTNSDPNVPGTQDNPYTVAEARAAIDANSGVTGVYATGIVSEIVTAYSDKFGNVTFDMVDENGTTVSLRAYRCTGDKAAEVAVGDVVVVKGNLTKYNSTYEFEQGCEIVSLQHSMTPSITVASTSVEVSANGGEGTIEVTYNNITEVAAAVKFYQEDGTTETTYNWVTAEVNSDNNNVNYTISANDGEARTAYMKVYVNDVYSDLITITQAAPVNDYAELPFEFDGGSSDIESTSGLSAEGLGDYNNSPKLKFDGTDDYLLLQFNETPGTLTFDIKGNGFSGGTFTVQTSVDGVTFTDLVSYTELGATQSEKFDNLAADVRYIKWIYTEKISGNVALGNIKLAKPDNTPSISVASTSVAVEQEGGNGVIEVTYKNIDTTAGVEIVWYESDGVTALSEKPEWISSAEINTNTQNIDYQIAENTGDERKAYLKVYALDANANDVYSDLITITQTAYVAPFEPVTYTLASSITPGKHYIIASAADADAEGNAYAMGGQNSNNRAAVAIKVDGDKAQVNSADVREFVISIPEADGFYAIYDETESGYLYAASSGSNYLRTETTLDDNGKWTIEFAEGVATIKAQGTNTHCWMQYNSTNTLFACYLEDKPQADVYLYEKDEDKTTVVTISELGYATFGSAEAVDFSETNLTVYTAKVNDTNSEVELTEVSSKQVPAGEAVLLRGEAGSYSGKVIESADRLTDNDLKLATADLTGNGKIYVLNKVDDKVGFYKLSAEGTLSKGKAYLESESAAPFLGFDGEDTTGINSVERGTLSVEGCYTLDGRRVAQPTKGLYIVNGKKVVIK